MVIHLDVSLEQYAKKLNTVQLFSLINSGRHMEIQSCNNGRMLPPFLDRRGSIVCYDDIVTRQRSRGAAEANN